MIRAFRINHYTGGFKLIWRVFKSKARELLVSALLTLTIIVSLSFVIYAFEKDEQPIEFGSIPRTLYWTFITLSTIGYGNIHVK